MPYTYMYIYVYGIYMHAIYMYAIYIHTYAHKESNSPQICYEKQKLLPLPFTLSSTKLLSIYLPSLWLIIGRTDAEAPIVWPADAKSQLTGKNPDSGKD